MKSLLHYSAIMLFLAGCSGSKDVNKTNTSSEPMAVGWIQRNDFMTSAYPRFQEVYDSTRIEEPFVEMIRQLQADVEVVVVLGTWCSDSKKHVPHFLKIADLAGIPASRIKFYGVDRTKKSNDGVTDRYRIERVPTFIFLKQGAEIGRIVEAPRTSVEEDMLAILAASE